MRKPQSFRSVLIFGGAGFIGSNWARSLLEHTDAKVHIYDNLSRNGIRHNLEELQRMERNGTVLASRDALEPPISLQNPGYWKRMMPSTANAKP